MEKAPKNLLKVFFLLVIIVVLAGFTIVVQKTQFAWKTPEINYNTAVFRAIQLAPVVIEQAYANSAFTLKGSIEVSDPCARLDTNADFSGEEQEKIKLIIETTIADQDCAGAATKKDFIVVIPTPKYSALDSVEVNGQSVAFELKIGR
ncbi:MAG: hypothetical protein HY397_00165 [Candidatus Doudnabacteria bacterium]|nr:hypothetical protein [Candidatus Doudnabacteria bacterium]